MIGYSLIAYWGTEFDNLDTLLDAVLKLTEERELREFDDPNVWSDTVLK